MVKKNTKTKATKIPYFLNKVSDYVNKLKKKFFERTKMNHKLQEQHQKT